MLRPKIIKEIKKKIHQTMFLYTSFLPIHVQMKFCLSSFHGKLTEVFCISSTSSDGDVRVNWATATKNNTTVRAGDIISVSGKGRLKVS